MIQQKSYKDDDKLEASRHLFFKEVASSLNEQASVGTLFKKNSAHLPSY